MSIDLDIKSVRIKDDVRQRAKSCDVVLAPSGFFSPPAVEFGIPGDSEVLTGSTLRPNGATIEINAAYANVPSHSVFKGVIEFMDDVTSDMSDIFRVKLSAMPKNQPHRKPISRVFNRFLSDLGSNSGGPSMGTLPTSVSILEAICGDAGLSIGRNDMPSYAIEGTWENIHQTPVQCAERLLTPFNMFDYLKFFVRTDEDGLQIIKIDFTKAPGGTVYDIPNVIEVTRTFELYMPDARLGDSPVLLVGADKLGYPENSPSGPVPPAVYRRTAQETYTTTSRSSGAVPDFERWIEKRSTIQFVLDVYATSPFDVPSSTDLDAFINALRLGTITGLKIVASRPVNEETREYDTVNGLIRSQSRYFTYADDEIQAALTQDEEQEFIYPGGKKINYRMTRRTYTQDANGIQVAVNTHNYYGYRDQWVASDANIEHGNSVAATNAEIQRLLDNIESGNLYPANPDPIPEKNRKVHIGQYQLLDGEVLGILPPGLPSANLTLNSQPAFRISCPGMNYDGLLKVKAVIDREQEIEKTNAYWEKVTVRASLDTVPAVGTSAKVRGAYGIVVGVTHDINESSGTSTIELWRLHLSDAG